MASLIVVSPRTPLAEEDASVAQRAQTFFDRGIQFYAEGNYSKAVVEFRKAYDLKPNDTIGYNIVRTYPRLGNCSSVLEVRDELGSIDSLDALSTTKLDATVSACRVASSASTRSVRIESTDRSSSDGSSTSSTTDTSGHGPWRSSRLFVFGTFGFGGELDLETDIQNASNPADQTVDMQPTTGVGVHFGVPINRYVTIGGRTTFFWWSTEDSDDAGFDRFMALNIDIAPKARYPFAGGDAEVYATIPVGMTLNIPNSSNEKEFEEILAQRGQDIPVNIVPTVSWNLSLLAGVAYRFTSTFGVFAEGGWYNQHVRRLVELEGSTRTVEVDQTGVFSQFGLNGGLVLTF
ncbi:MAG: hypothetical protein ABEL76_06585 [Bradymonadaceae bacterium]